MEQLDKPAIICLHGALGCAKQMEQVLQPFSKQVQVHAFDFPGHGSKAQLDLNLSNCVAATRDYILQNNLAGTTIFGYSMGGYVALIMSKLYPELVGQIITLGTVIDWNPYRAAQEVKKLNPEIILEKVPKYAAQLEEWHGKEWPIVLGATAELMLDLGNKPQLTEADFERIMHPVLMCLAEGDNLVTREETIKTVWAMPFGEFAEIAKSNHPIEQVDIDTLQGVIQPYV